MLTLALRGGSALLLFLALMTGTYSVAVAATGAPSLLGLRGLQRYRMLRESPLFERAEPLVRWLGVRIRPFVSDSLRTRLDRELMLGGDYWGLVAEEFVSACLLSSAGFASAGLLAAYLLDKGVLYPVLGGVLGLAAPLLDLQGVQQKRSKRFRLGLPYVIDLLGLALSAGLDFAGALNEVVEKSSTPDDPLIMELKILLQELQVGKTRKEALTQFANRAPGETVREFVSAIVQAEERGNPLGHVLRIQAEASRQSRSVRAEEAAAKASVKILAPLMLAFIAVILLIAAPMALQLTDSLNSE
jgi:tight adherence protein C